MSGLFNLINNAVKYTDYGEVRLNVRIAEHQKEKDTITLAFEVKDTGIGIPQDKLGKVFDTFEQAHPHLAYKYGGTGLGLAIVKKLVDIQGGTVSVQSEISKGSVFTFTLKFGIGQPDGIRKLPPEEVSANSNVSDKRILLVEDNKLNQMVAERFLKGWGINVEIAEDGKEAVDKLRDNDYDAVLMDIQLPEMNGYEATKYIRQKLTGNKKNIPILAMTAHAFRGEEEKCIRIGMNGYISKPIKRELLLSKLIQLFNNNKQ